MSQKDQEDAIADSSDFYSNAEAESSAPKRRTKRKQGTSANGPVDPVLPEKKRARRRLVGAVALVLAAVIGLPMVFEHEPKPLAHDIAIEIPPKDQPSSSKEAANQPVDMVDAASSLDQDEEIIEPPSDVKRMPRLAPEQTAAVKEVKAEPPVVIKDSPKKVEKGNAESARSALDGQSDKKAEPVKTAAENKGSKFVVQVAALASQDKVNELQSKLKGAGIASYTQRVATESGDRIRIRIGPFSSKEEADKTRAKLAKLGLNGALVPV